MTIGLDKAHVQVAFGTTNHCPSLRLLASSGLASGPTMQPSALARGAKRSVQLQQVGSSTEKLSTSPTGTRFRAEQ